MAMFRSLERDVVFPQNEHARFAGLIAFNYGNKNFPRPNLPFDSLVNAASSHHLGYLQVGGWFDTVDFRNLSALEIYEVIKRDAEVELGDLMAETLIIIHNRRLLGRRLSQSAESILDAHHLMYRIFDFALDGYRRTLDGKIKTNVDKLEISWTSFLEADRVMDLADKISFDRALEKPVRKVMFAEPSTHTTPISYSIEASGDIQVNPWPFGVDSFSGFMTGYQAFGYPERLHPVIAPYRVYPGK